MWRHNASGLEAAESLHEWKNELEAMVPQRSGINLWASDHNRKIRLVVAIVEMIPRPMISHVRQDLRCNGHSRTRIQSAVTMELNMSVLVFSCLAE